MKTKNQLLNLGQLLEAEKEIITKRRHIKGIKTNLEEDSFGIALSGGGIRSATVNLGVMEILNGIELIEKADYLSSVSGGGYLASYIHSSLNGSKKIEYKDLFKKENIKRLRNYRRYLLLFPKNKLGRFFSWIVLISVVVSSLIFSWLWIIIPLLLWKFQIIPVISEFSFFPKLIVYFIIGIAVGSVFSPNWTAPHWYYKFRLSLAYLWRNKGIQLKDLNNEKAPYPLINATVHVNYDNYTKSKIASYRGRIKSNYFLFSPNFCGSQVTGYTKTVRSNYENYRLSTAMATSAAAVNSFMGNIKLPWIIQKLLVLGNLRTGILAPNPHLSKWWPTFWPYYTLLELLDLPSTKTHRIQVSDGGHIENLAIYELLRRRVKTIIAVDAGQDEKFDFSDLRNLVIRARNELGVIVKFHDNGNPLDIIYPNKATGFSKNHFVVAKLSGLKGSYADGYEGILVYIKSTILPKEKFTLREQKNRVKELNDKRNPKDKNSQLNLEFKKERRILDRDMYRTYTSDFPHQSTSDQFFDIAQWDAYHHLGKTIGQNVIDEIGIKEHEDVESLFFKCSKYYGDYQEE